MPPLPAHRAATTPAPVAITARRSWAAPVHALVSPSDEASADELARALADQLAAPPPLVVGRDGAGGVDIRLNDVQGLQVKSGVVVLEAPGGEVAVPLDPVSRRFRVTGLAPGDYTIRAAAAAAGQGSAQLAIREGDVTRAIVGLDGSPPQGVTELAMRFDAARRLERVHVRVRDLLAGAVVHDGYVAVRDGLAVIHDMPIGKLHVDVVDDAGARSCYDADPGSGHLSDLLRRIVHERVEYLHLIDPNPPDPVDLGAFRDLGDHVAGVARYLPQLGVHTVEQLAASEGEGLMHIAQALHASGRVPAQVDSAMFGVAIQAARSRLGLSSGLAAHVGEAAMLEQAVSIALPTVKQQIDRVYRSVAARNPGVATSIDEALLAEGNVRGWLHLARSYLDLAGICSLDDLGRFRLNPLGVLRPGAYVAPAKQPVGLRDAAVLEHYRLAGVLGDAVLHYRPNDTLHDAAVVLGTEWDISGQSVTIGKELRELVVIVRSIRWDAGSRITWEMPQLPPAPAYWPNPADFGPNGGGPGQDGHPGQSGAEEPSPTRNGGADAVTPAPTVTMFVLDTTNGLPPIDLPGQDGGPGGRGQDGGRGGDGAQGEHADSSFLSCCRAVGWGGKGGRGGARGRGGPGGRGGQGGRMTILTSPTSIAVLASGTLTVALNPGEGGPGGPPGSPGAGGKGGPAGSADCELFCAEHPERRGADGPAGDAILGEGRRGDRGMPPLSDAFQLLPLTPEQWQAEFDRPHILHVAPTDVEPGQVVEITGQNFDPAGDKVFFDGALLPDEAATVTSATGARFTVPQTAAGGTHPIVIRPAGLTDRLSNRVSVRVLPVLDPIAAGTRWVEGQEVTISGLAFGPGVQVFAEDRSVRPVPSFALEVRSSDRTSIQMRIPAGPLGALRGVRRLVVRNNDGGTSRGDPVVRISDTIVVRCAAFRVLGTSPGAGCRRSAAEIAHLFEEGALNSLSVAWAPARIVFRLVQPVADITIDDARANMWPAGASAAARLRTDREFQDAHGVPGVLNVYFFADTERGTAYAYIGGGPIFAGDEPGHDMTAVDFMQVIAHEAGHAMCLQHVCAKPGVRPEDTYLGHACQDADTAFLMHPNWDVGDGLGFPPAPPGKPLQIEQARIGASRFEDGKRDPTGLFGFNCATADTEA